MKEQCMLKRALGENDKNHSKTIILHFLDILRLTARQS